MSSFAYYSHPSFLCDAKAVDQDACAAESSSAHLLIDDNWRFRNVSKDEENDGDWLGRPTSFTDYNAYLNTFGDGGDGGDDILRGYERSDWGTAPDNLFDPADSYVVGGGDDDDFFARDLPNSLSSLTWDETDSEASPVSDADHRPNWIDSSQATSTDDEDDSDDSDDEGDEIALPINTPRPAKPELTVEIPVVTACLESPSSSSSENIPRYTCPVCIGPQNNLSSIKCGHVFCTECARRAVATTARCPLCRSPAKLKHVRRIFLA